MNEEIYQDIENEGGRLAERYCKHDDADIQREGFQAYLIGYKAGANLILSKWQEAERWRKVEEELPPMLIDVLFKVHVYAENYQSQGYTVGHLDSGYFHFQRSDADIIKIEPEEWKPIND